MDQIAECAAGCPASLILCGHTHIPRAVQLNDGRLIVNPGSVGVPAYASDLPWPHSMEAGTPHARYAILDKRNPGWQVEFFQVEYDWAAASHLAAARNRPDWAIALVTGRVDTAKP